MSVAIKLADGGFSEDMVGDGIGRGSLLSLRNSQAGHRSPRSSAGANLA
jgi:hypothetical protein